MPNRLVLSNALQYVAFQEIKLSGDFEAREMLQNLKVKYKTKCYFSLNVAAYAVGENIFD